MEAVKVMVFHFNIDYKTVYGEELVLNMTVDGKEVQYKMVSGAGAAGGLGYAFLQYFNAEARPASAPS